MERKSPIATSIQPKSIRAALLPTSWICAKVKTNGNIWQIKVGNNCVQNGPRKLLFLIGLKCLWREEKFRTKKKYSNTKSKTYIYLSCHYLEYFIESRYIFKLDSLTENKQVDWQCSTNRKLQTQNERNPSFRLWWGKMNTNTAKPEIEKGTWNQIRRVSVKVHWILFQRNLTNIANILWTNTIILISKIFNCKCR